MCSTDRKRLLGQCFTPSAFDHALTGMKCTDLWVRIDWGDEQIAQGNTHSPLSLHPSLCVLALSLPLSFPPSCISLCPCLSLSLSFPSIYSYLPSLTHLFPLPLYPFISVYLYIYIYLKRKRGIPLFPSLPPPSLPPPSPPFSKWVSQPSVKSSREL